MGHLVEQVEVDAIETQVSKTTTSTSQTTPAQHLSGPQQQGEGGPQLTSGQGRVVSGSPRAAHQNLARNTNKQKDNEEGSPDKKPRESNVEGDGEEDEGGWWAEMVMMGALGGVASYRDAWYRGHTHLLHGDGPLPHTWRLYIAALAVCRHEVGWLMQALLGEFRTAGGEARWVSGLQHAPAKFSALASINAILAHQPWLLSPQHIQQLTKGEDSWSLGELCQALCIMTHFHALTTFLHGVGLSTYTRPTKENEENTKDRNSTNCKSSIPVCKPRSDASDTTTSSTACKRTVRSDTSKTSKVGKSRGQQRIYTHLTVNPTYAYEDFNCSDESRVPSLSIQDYNWQDHGYAMCSRLVGEVGSLLDERFSTALALTHTPAPKQLAAKPSHSPNVPCVDQQNNAIPSHEQESPLPIKALWNYVQWLLGIHRDDCDYNALNKHLEPQLKAFLKTSCCFPETLTADRTTAISSVQVKASVVVMEARLQSEMLYALRAIMLHQC